MSASLSESPNATFAEPANTVVLTLGPLLKGLPITCVEHDEQGQWQFLDGRLLVETRELALVPLALVLRLHPTLAELADLPKGWRAFRMTKDGPWERESRALKEKTRARMTETLAEMQRNLIRLPPGSPSTTDMIREGREK